MSDEATQIVFGALDGLQDETSQVCVCACVCVHVILYYKLDLLQPIDQCTYSIRQQVRATIGSRNRVEGHTRQGVCLCFVCSCWCWCRWRLITHGPGI